MFVFFGAKRLLNVGLQAVPTLGRSGEPQQDAKRRRAKASTNQRRGRGVFCEIVVRYTLFTVIVTFNG